MRQPAGQVGGQVGELVPEQVGMFLEVFQAHARRDQAVEDVTQRPLMLVDVQLVFLGMALDRDRRRSASRGR